MGLIYVGEGKRWRAAGGDTRLIRGLRGARAQRCCECQPNVFHDRAMQHKGKGQANKSEQCANRGGACNQRLCVKFLAPRGMTED